MLTLQGSGPDLIDFICLVDDNSVNNIVIQKETNMFEQEPLSLEQVDSENLANRKAVASADLGLRNAWDMYERSTPAGEIEEEPGGEEGDGEAVRSAGIDLADALKAAKKFNEVNYDSLHELASLEDAARTEAKSVADQSDTTPDSEV